MFSKTFGRENLAQYERHINEFKLIKRGMNLHQKHIDTIALFKLKHEPNESTLDDYFYSNEVLCKIFKKCYEDGEQRISNDKSYKCKEGRYQALKLLKTIAKRLEDQK